MFELCLFDLDDTLLRTSDMDELRRSGKNVDTEDYKRKVITMYYGRENRHLYPESYLLNLRKESPQTKFGIFTRSPTAYAHTLLQLAYPNFPWDVSITFESVKRTKPFGDGVREAMRRLNIETPQKVVLIGDGDNDIRAAYNAGISVILDKSSWGARYSSDNWRALNHMPDAMIELPTSLSTYLGELTTFRPDLERRLVGGRETPGGPRFDRIGKFIPRDVGGDKTAYQVYTCGRSFSNYASLLERRNWHALSQSIQDNKNSSVFPESWVLSIKSFIGKHFHYPEFGPSVVITVIPHRPGRKARLEMMLMQLQDAFFKEPAFAAGKMRFEPTLLAYKDGVRSHSKEYLTASQRFANVRDHLYVQKPNIVEDGKRVLVIDDVCTTGASLIYAGVRLEEAGASDVTRLSIAMNVGDVLRNE